MPILQPDLGGGEAPRVLPALTARVTELLQLEKYGDHQLSPVTE